LTGKRLGGRGRGGSSGTWHAIAFDRRNPFVWVYSLHYHYWRVTLSKLRTRILYTMHNCTPRIV